MVYFRTTMQSTDHSLTVSVSSNVSGPSGVEQVKVVISHSRREDSVVDLTGGSRSSQVCPRLLSLVTGLLIVLVIFRVLLPSPHPQLLELLEMSLI